MREHLNEVAAEDGVPSVGRIAVRRTEQESSRAQVDTALCSVNWEAMRNLAHVERVFTISAMAGDFEPRERPSRSGALRKN